ncbi:MAG: hypothetical protein KC419_08985, partial [Anaerolineales bacterium]|nr:hypothetical protein [Anaerolineales bacterium]
LNAGGTLTVISSTIQSNQADNNGGGINNLSGSVSLSNSVIFNNRADKGGGIYNLDSSGTMSLIDSSLISNTAVASGGAVFNGGLLTMMSSTVSTNTAVISGGGIIQLGGVMTVTNSTLSGNEAPDGSGIYNNNSNALLLNSTIHNNIATFGAGIAHLNGLLALKNTIVSFNLPGGDCTGAVVSNGHNLDSDDSCNLVAPSDHPGVDPLLDPLQDNGGPTWTHALQWGSPAIEGGDSTRCPATDQRGVGRFGVCDIGAYEFEIELLYLPSVLNSSITGTPTPTPTPNNCRKQVPVFTTDTAPTDGTLEFHVLYGELGRIEGITLKVWDVAAGQQINNELVDVKAPKWVRVWWQPDGDPEWYLLPSQYWVGDGTVYSEYGVSCGDAPVPSYHTSFGSAIPESDVPIFTLPLGEDWAALIKLVQFQRVDQAEELNP